MVFKPLACPERWHGLAAVGGILLLDALLLSALRGRPADGLGFLLGLLILLSIPVGAWLAYRTFGTFTLEYWIDRNAVTLVWGASRQVVPLGAIRQIARGGGVHPRTPVRPWHWPCRSRRRIATSDLGVVNSYATRALAEQVILVTSGESFGLSPRDADGFVKALQERFTMGPARAVDAELRRPPIWTWRLWRDRAALITIGLGLLGVLLMFGLLSFRFPYLSADLPLHFDVNGLPDRIDAKSGLFALPLLGLVTWFMNTAAGVWLYRHVQHEAAYLLWGGALVVQGIAGLALINLMRW